MDSFSFVPGEVSKIRLHRSQILPQMFVWVHTNCSHLHNQMFIILTQLSGMSTGWEETSIVEYFKTIKLFANENELNICFLHIKKKMKRNFHTRKKSGVYCTLTSTAWIPLSICAKSTHCQLEIYRIPANTTVKT